MTNSIGAKCLQDEDGPHVGDCVKEKEPIPHPPCLRRYTGNGNSNSNSGGCQGSQHTLATVAGAFRGVPGQVPQRLTSIPFSLLASASSELTHRHTGNANVHSSLQQQLQAASPSVPPPAPVPVALPVDVDGETDLERATPHFQQDRSLPKDKGHQHDDFDLATKKSLQNSKRDCFIISALLFAGGLGLVLIPLLTTSRGGENQTTHSHSHSSEFNLEETLLQELANQTQYAILYEPHSYQAHAYRWLVHDPAFASSEYSLQRLVQRFALASLYLSMNGNKWFQKTHWLSYDHHECDWDFTVPDHDVAPGYEKRIPVVDNGTTGVCHSHNNEEKLERLWLTSNNLVGDQLPKELYLLSNLKSIMLDRNEIQGVLSSEIGKLRLLEELVIPRNHLEGSIPSELGLLTSLQNLVLGRNNFVSTLATELGQMADLKWLTIHRNQLTGSLPTEIALLTNMEALQLSFNSLSGTIPTELGFLESLTGLELASNVLSGSVPTELSNLSALSELHLTQNELFGSIPSALCSLEALTDLTVDPNVECPALCNCNSTLILV